MIGSRCPRSDPLRFREFDIDPLLLSGVDSAGYLEATPIQEHAIPVALRGQDVLGLAQTGTGKTAAFAIPILQHFIRSTRAEVKSTTPKKIKSLIIAPTRELADQINKSVRTLGIRIHFSSLALYGGVNKKPQEKALAKGVDLVVACPGRLLDHLTDQTISLSSVEILVLDEADTMCDMGFFPDVRKILKYLPHQKQTLFFAATMPQEIRELSADLLDNPELVQMDRIAPAKTVSHALYPTTGKMKKRMVIHLLKQTRTGQVMVFTRTKRRARFLAADLENSGFKVAPLQGNMSQNKRQQAIDGFRKGKYDILVATDIASRGIDVSEVTHVINYDMPQTVDSYIHRIGRTGRALNVGEAFTLSVDEDEPVIQKVERLLGQLIERRRLDDFDYGGFSPNAKKIAAPLHKPRSSGHKSHSNQNNNRHGRANPRRVKGSYSDGSNRQAGKTRNPEDTKSSKNNNKNRNYRSHRQEKETNGTSNGGTERRKNLSSKRRSRRQSGNSSSTTR